MSKTCPKCNGVLNFEPGLLPISPGFGRGVLAWIGSEVTFWIVLILVGGAAACFGSDQHLFAAVLGAVAGAIVFVKVLGMRFEQGTTSEPEPLFYCRRCQRYFKPASLEGGASAI
jgi:hypothetical protein